MRFLVIGAPCSDDITYVWADDVNHLRIVTHGGYLKSLLC